MGNFFTDTIQNDSRYTSTDAISDMDLLAPWFREKVEQLIKNAADQGTELVVTETYRSSERQQQLFDQGKTQLRTVGVHHYGLACDFAKMIDGKMNWGGDWNFMVTLCATVGLISGADWGQPDKPHTFRDWDHVQGVTIEQQAALFAGTWYPGDDGLGQEGHGTLAPVPAVAARPAQATDHGGLTDPQQVALQAFDSINAASFGNWFKRSTGMAFIETESAFDPKAIRHEPSGVTSYGLMQVLDSTAAGLGLHGDASQMFDPKIGIFYGLKYLAQGWNYLTQQFGRPPTMAEWQAGYNEGYGAAAKGRPNPNYVAVCEKNRQHWLYLDD